MDQSDREILLELKKSLEETQGGSVKMHNSLLTLLYAVVATLDEQAKSLSQIKNMLLNLDAKDLDSYTVEIDDTEAFSLGLFGVKDSLDKN